MRVLFILILAIVPGVAQTPLVRMMNPSRPFSPDFEVGDRFEIVITGAPHQPVSVRTTRQGRTDWSSVIGSTDSTGRWSTLGRFGKSDFGGWGEVWTVGGKLAVPGIQFSVKPPCLAGGQGFAQQSGVNTYLTCDTAEGRQSFVTPSFSDSFRTPDGRLVGGRPSEQTQEEYHAEILMYYLTSGIGAARVALQSSRGGLGDETADRIRTLIGVNALSEEETRNLLGILRAAFARPETIQPDARIPSRTLALLRHLEDLGCGERLQREIAETIEYVQSR